MPRTETRVFTSIWNDDEFRALPSDAKTLYFALITQPEMRWCGVVTYSPRTWARRIGWDDERLHGAAKSLAEARFIFIDEDTEELLVRSMIRRDETWKAPKVFRCAIVEAEHTESEMLRAAIYAELLRIDPAEAGEKTRGQVVAILSNLPKRLVNALADSPEGPADPPPHGPADPRADDPAEGPPQGRHAGGAEGRREPRRQARAEGVADGAAERDLDPPAQPLADPRAEGDRSRAHARGSCSCSYSNPPLPPPSALPDVNPEGEGDDSELETWLAETTDVVRGIRPDWSSSSIRRALTHPDVAERGWDRARAAMLTVAADPASQQPGRLAHDGPWWRPALTVVSSPPRPPWCGECDEQTRLTTGDHPARCRNCHPLREVS